MNYFLFKSFADLSDICAGNLPGSSGTCNNQGPATNTNAQTISDILSIVFAIIGALALLMIVVSGLRYVNSAGDPDKISRAKNGVVYALIGLVLAISAEAIVAFVINRL